MAIAQEDIACQRLFSKNLDKADLLQAKNYTPGDILRFGRDFAVAKKADYFTVVACDAEKNLLNCDSSTGNKFTINPAKIAIQSRMSVYKAESCQLAVGDRIKLRLTNERRGHIANTEYTVANIDQNKAWIHNDKGSLELKFNEKHDSHWDYAYTNTAYGIQGATSKFVIALELSARTQATNHRSHEIDISRASIQATIYTDNKQALVERLSNRAKQSVINKKSAYQLHEITNKKIITTSNHEKALSTHDIHVELTQQVEKLACHLLGELNPHLSSANELRYGKKGSLSINVSNGLWTSFETGEKGNALQLISSQLGFGDFKDTINYAKDFLNHKENSFNKKITNTSKNSRTNNKTDYAKKLVEKSLPIKGTLAEFYLKNYRKVNHFENADLRFIPQISTLHGSKRTQVPALLAIAKNQSGEINHVQVIRLDPMTGDKDEKSQVIKQTYGTVKGCVIDLNKSSTSKL
ncbi:MAG: hypothetical protein A3E88_07950 [Legionellales bacterium RIFCSPHIGHO2_12_FULL_35_11]|nr:MAG: hypothetical protein A3E88_07950 [Legionellales bacterium RIFCSPHIGHO2_12_FULL_35_11]